MTEHTLYTDANREWFFLVPNEYVLPEGEADVYTIMGRRVLVNPDAIMHFEIPRHEAETWLSHQLKGLVGDTGRALKAIWQAFRNYGNPNKPKSHLNMDLLADLMGEPVEALKQSSAASKQGWQRLLGEGLWLLEALKSRDPKKLDQARDYIHAMSDILRKHKIPAGDMLEKWVEEFIGALE